MAQNGRVSGRERPAGACDCHAHLFGPQARFPFIASRRYTPDDAPWEAYRAELHRLGLARAVLSAPSVHGLDNSALFEGLRLGGPILRGITMVTAEVTDAELERQHGLGVRGIRTQLKPGSAKPLSIADLKAFGPRLKTLGWHLEIHIDVGAMPDALDELGDFPTPVVIEHMGHMPTGFGLDHPGFQGLLRWLERPTSWVKLSGAYINSALPPPHGDVRPFVEALVAVAPERLVFGSNWPHPHQDRVPDALDLLDTMTGWIGEDRMNPILAANPARLYDFN